MRPAAADPASFEWGPTIDDDACMAGCTTCLDFCQNGVYALVDGHVSVVRRAACVAGCSHCATLCEAGALSFPSLADLRASRRRG